MIHPVSSITHVAEHPRYEFELNHHLAQHHLKSNHNADLQYSSNLYGEKKNWISNIPHAIDTIHNLFFTGKFSQILYLITIYTKLTT